MRKKLEKIPKFPGIYRILLVDKQTGKLNEPVRGNKFVACVEVGRVDGQRRRPKRGFRTFAEAKEFRNSSTVIKDVVRESFKPKSKMKFKELGDRWVADMLPHLESTTQARYRSYLQHFKFLDEMDVESIDPSAIDSWISFVKRPEYLANLNVTRCGFEHEFLS